MESICLPGGTLAQVLSDRAYDTCLLLGGLSEG